MTVATWLQQARSEAQTKTTQHIGMYEQLLRHSDLIHCGLYLVFIG